ncbi:MULTISPECIES: helix-turn-helix domain-containing protein [Actinomadura]|uniref:Helix-turn-helix domain-containing protein n=1 Tax=Actinomadura yumaensis TaxID=111807 RepID=A0ABW2CVG1_9ACTN|nr:helix-turn-helix transcriptional regulator [Actinomadura sp. J1-007]MWK39145.1 helix-turn-helix domain-containing protein [Actinomadura sp. J1-007]
MRDDDVRLTYRRRRIGEALRRFRVDLGLTQRAAGRLLDYSQASLSSYENGHRAIRPRDLKHILNEYGVTDQLVRDRLLSLASQGRQDGWWHDFDERLEPGIVDYAALESEAVFLRNFEAQLVPGLFQTEDYARAVISSSGLALRRPHNAEADVEFRMMRQALHDRPNPPRISAVLGEAALHVQMGGPSVMRCQYAKLLEMAELPHVELQIVPFSAGGHPAVDGSFTIIGIGPDALLEVVAMDSLTRSWYVDEPSDVEHYHLAMDRLREIALPEIRSRDLIERLSSDV